MQNALKKSEELYQYKNKISNHRILYVVFGIIIMLCLGTVYSWSIFRPTIENVFHIGSTRSGLPYMFSLLFYALFMCFTGKYIEKFKPGTIIIFGGLLAAAGWILAGSAGNIYWLTLFYGVMIGSGVGIAYGVPMNVAAKWFPEKKGLMIGMVLIGFGGSPLFTAPFAKFLMDIYGVMRTFQILGVIFGICITILALFIKYPSEEIIVNISGQEIANQTDTKAMIKSTNFKKLYITFIIGTMIGLMIVGMTGNVGIELIRISPAKAASFTSLFAIFNGIGRPAFGWFADRISHKKAMLVSYFLILVAATLMLLAGSGDSIIYIIAFSLFWLNLGGWLAIAPATTMSLFGERNYSRNYGIVFTAYGIGAIAGVATSGLLKDFFQSYHEIFYLIILLCIIGIMAARKID